jgi:predicted kinase
MTTATVLIGVSGSGKSTFLFKNNYDVYVCSTDKYVDQYAKDRELDYSDAFDKIQEENLFKDFTRLFYIDIENCIRNNVDFVIDRTNLTIGFRQKLIGDIKSLADKYDKKVKINGICFDLPKNVVKERLADRFTKTRKSIPEDVIENQFNAFEKPTVNEGFDNLEVISQ